MIIDDMEYKRMVERIRWLTKSREKWRRLAFKLAYDLTDPDEKTISKTESEEEVTDEQ